MWSVYENNKQFLTDLPKRKRKNSCFIGLTIQYHPKSKSKDHKIFIKKHFFIFKINIKFFFYFFRRKIRAK